MKNKLISLSRFFIGWPVSVISIFFIVKLIYSSSPDIAKLENLNYFYLVISVILFLIYFFLRGVLWYEIVKIKGNKLSFKKSVYYWQISELKRYTPGNIWSFLSRATLFTKDNLTKKNLLLSLITEGILLVISGYVLSYFYLSDLFKNQLITYFLFLISILTILIYTFSNYILKTQTEKVRKFLAFVFFDNSPSVNFKLILTSILTFVSFGFASFFSAISITYIDLHNLPVLVSLFIFSFLIGYISIVTPMGLGVREAITTAGLSKFTSLPVAGIISIFSRIVLILSELIFLFFSYLSNKLENKITKKTGEYVQKNKFFILLLVFIFIYILYFTGATFLRYDNFFSGRFDLGNMDQTVWNTVHGRIFKLTDPDGTNIISRLSIHADFILILISPLYFIWQNPKMLLLLQSVVLAFGALFVYLIAKEISKNKKFSLIISICYLLNPALQFTNLYDFHGITLATTFLLGAFYFLVKKRNVLLVIFLLLAASTKEEIWIYFSIFGIAIAIRQFIKRKSITDYKELLFTVFLIFTGFFMFYEFIWKIIPYFRGGDHFALSYYSDFGGSATAITKNILFNPVKILTTVFHKDNLTYFFELFGPLGFIPLIGLPFLFFAAPDFAVNLLSSNLQLHQIYYQYSAALTPFIFIAAMFGAKFVNLKIKRISLTAISLFMLISTLSFQYFIGPLPFSLKPNIDMFSKQLTYANEINDFIESIPTRYSIAATNNLGSHLSHRQNIYTIPVGINKADVILFLLNDPFAQPSPKAQKQMAENMETDKNYVQVYKKDDFIVFEKRNLYIQPVPKPKKGETILFPYSIPALIDRGYETSQITNEKQISTKGKFKSYIISYQVDGLREYALMNIPNVNPPINGFPVVIIDHGYIQPNLYSTENSYKSEADYFANNGFLVLKPDYRGNGNSDVIDTSVMRFAYPVDVLTLINSISNVKQADANNVFLWGHSMGGEVTLEVMEVISAKGDFSTKTKAAVLWAPVTDPVKWFSLAHLPLLPEAKLTPYPYSNTFQVLGTPEENPELWNSLSPLNYLNNINIPLLLQHGMSDTTVPYSWSQELSSDLKKINKNVTFISYQNDNHNLPLSWQDAITSDLNFYKSLQK